MWDVSGVSGAAPIWHEVMDRLQRPAPSRPPAPPAGVVATRVRVKSHREPAWVEFPGGNRDGERGAGTRPRIAYPGQGAMAALHPDIPADRQRIALRAGFSGGRHAALDPRRDSARLCR